MRHLVIAVMLVCATAVTGAAQKKPFEINTQTPEGVLLSDAVHADDEAKQTALFEEFIQKYPKHDGVPFAGTQLQTIYLKSGSLDKVIQTAETILAVDPALPLAAYNALQAAEQKKDYAAIQSWALRTVDAAKKELAVPKPDSDTQDEQWAKDQDYAKQVIVRCEYSLFHSAVETQDPQAKANLGEALISVNPDSQYLAQTLPHYLFGLMQTGQAAKASAVAEKMLEKDPSNDDLLLLVADNSLSGKNFDKAATSAAKAIETLKAKTAPEGTDAAAWQKAHDTKLGRAYFIAGSAANESKKYADADKSFRAALPLLQGNNDMLAPAYFYLGFLNHEMAKAQKLPAASRAMLADAKKFTGACAAIAGPYQETCKKNLAGMQAGR
jgi:tetratricopeptide (TPR) repeat protein